MRRDSIIDFSWIAEWPAVLSFFGVMTVILETFYFPAVLMKKARFCWVFLVIGMHIIIAIVLGLYFFSAIMICFNLVTWMPIDQGLLKRLESRNE